MLQKQFYYKKNRLQQLRGFYYAAQYGNVSKAAEQMNLNQSTVTLQIQSLERDLGVSLFERKGKGFTLTADGKLFYDMSVPHIQGIDGLYEQFIETKKAAESNILHVGGIHVGVLYILPEYIKTYRDLYPDVQLHVHNLSTQEALDRLLSEELDVFISTFTDVPSEFEFVPLVDYQPILLLRDDHPLAGVEEVTLEQVSDYELVRIDPHLITLPMFEEIIRYYRLQSSIEFENADWEVLKQFVKVGVGVAIVSNIVLQESDTDLVGKPLERYFPKMTYGAIVKKGRFLAQSAQDFINMLHS